MPGCAAFNCTNSSAKGFLLKRFHSDPTRRRLWQCQVRHDSTSANLRLCEVHFEPHMWEETKVGGIRRLKPDAVPTLFRHIGSSLRQSFETKRRSDRKLVKRRRNKKRKEGRGVKPKRGRNQAKQNQKKNVKRKHKDEKSEGFVSSEDIQSVRQRTTQSSCNIS